MGLVPVEDDGGGGGWLAGWLAGGVAWRGEE